MSSPTSPDRTRAVIITLTVVIGLAVAAIPLFATLVGSDEPTASPASSSPTVADATSAPSTPSTATVATPVACPQPKDAAGLAPDAELRAVSLPCLTDNAQPGGSSLAEQLVGKPAVVNVWAWWCGPCRDELPVLEELAAEHPEWNVVGVHLDSKADAGASMLDQLGMTRLPSYQDSEESLAAATGMPRVVPITLVYRADGTRAALYPEVFETLAELNDAVEEALRQS